MMTPSPAPKPPRRLVWPWVLGGLLLLLAGAAGLALWLLPPWLEQRATDELISRLERRLELPVAIETVEVDLPRVTLRGITVGEPDRPLAIVEEVEVQLDEDALWGGRAEAVDVRVRRGAITGSREALVTLARSLRRRGAERSPPRRGRLTLVPEHLTLREIRLDLYEGSAARPSRQLQGVLAVNATPPEGHATVTLSTLNLEVDGAPPVRASAVRADITLARTPSGRSLQFPISLEVEGVGTQVTPEIAVAGVEGQISLFDAAATEISLALEGGFSDRDDGPSAAHLWSIAGRVRRDLSEGELEVSMEAFELARVPEVLARLPLVESEQATVGGRVALVFGGGLVRAEGDIRLDGLNVAHRLLAREPVRGVGFAMDFAAELEPTKPRLTVDRARVRRNGVELRLEGEIIHPAEPSDRRYRLHAEVSPTPCQQVLDAIPAALVPSLQGFEVGGTFDMGIDLEIDFADLEALRLGGGVGLRRCKVNERPPRAAAERLAGGFTHRVTMRDGRLRAVHLYPGSETFTPLPEISPYMVQAVLTTEDGGFFRHRGFLPSQFKTALVRNLQAGRVRLGASTITMQMVKNVLLSHERTLARKLQEMILTWYVETALTKPRIMEIYLNIVELGPGIYGVTRAAQHYFGKRPAELTPPEAVYLALMLPSPVRRHAHYCRGGLSSGFKGKVARILRVMNERKRLDDLDYEIWKDTPIEFDLRERGDSGACLGEIQHLMKASEGQRALTGLLVGSGEAGAPWGGFTGGGPSGRLSVHEDPAVDPADADAPGRPAMDERLGVEP